MIDNELLFQDIPYDQVTPAIDLAQEGYQIQPVGPGRGKLITFIITGLGLTFTGTEIYLIAEDSLDGINWGNMLRIGVGVQALANRGIKFALPSNASRFIRFSLSNAFTAGTYTIKAVLDET